MYYNSVNNLLFPMHEGTPVSLHYWHGNPLLLFVNISCVLRLFHQLEKCMYYLL